MSCPAPFEFFAVVLRPKRTFVAAAAVVFGTACLVAWTDPGSIDQITALALLCQMFAAATGFRERARQGHFDPVLVAGASRSLVAAAHWTFSVLPGALNWILLAVVESWTYSGRWPASLTPSGLTAFLWVSTAAWAVALPLTRFASGMLWLGTLFLLVALQWAERLSAPFIRAGSEWSDQLALGVAAVVNPFLLTMNPRAAQPASLLLILALTGTAAAAGWRYVTRLDGVLQDPR